jgi:hypothetical protein
MLTLIPNKVLSFVEMIFGNRQAVQVPTPESIRRYTERSLQKQLSCEEAANKIKYSIRTSYTVEQLNCHFPMLVTFASRYSHTVQGKAAEDSLRLAIHNRFKELCETM